MRGEVVTGLAGILVAALAQFIALLLAGAGHGWNQPFWFSAALWPLLPLVLIRVKRDAASVDRFTLNLGLLALALVLDVALIIRTVEEGTEYFMGMVATGPLLVALWLLLWLSWQVGALFLLFRKT